MSHPKTKPAMWPAKLLNQAIRTALKKSGWHPDRLTEKPFQRFLEVLESELLRVVPPVKDPHKDMEDSLAYSMFVAAQHGLVSQSAVVSELTTPPPEPMTAERVVAALLRSPDLAYAVADGLATTKLVGPWEEDVKYRWCRREASNRQPIGYLIADGVLWNAVVFPNRRGGHEETENGNFTGLPMDEARGWVDTRLLEQGYWLTPHPNVGAASGAGG